MSPPISVATESTPKIKGTKAKKNLTIGSKLLRKVSLRRYFNESRSDTAEELAESIKVNESVVTRRENFNFLKHKDNPFNCDGTKPARLAHHGQPKPERTDLRNIKSINDRIKQKKNKTDKNSGSVSSGSNFTDLSENQCKELENQQDQSRNSPEFCNNIITPFSTLQPFVKSTRTPDKFRKSSIAGKILVSDKFREFLEETLLMKQKMQDAVLKEISRNYETQLRYESSPRGICGPMYETYDRVSSESSNSDQMSITKRLFHPIDGKKIRDSVGSVSVTKRFFRPIDGKKIKDSVGSEYRGLVNKDKHIGVSVIEDNASNNIAISPLSFTSMEYESRSTTYSQESVGESIRKKEATKEFHKGYAPRKLDITDSVRKDLEENIFMKQSFLENSPGLSIRMDSEIEKRSRIENLPNSSDAENDGEHTVKKDDQSYASSQTMSLKNTKHSTITNESVNYKLGTSSDAESDGEHAVKKDDQSGASSQKMSSKTTKHSTTVELRLSRYLNHDTKCVPTNKVSDLENNDSMKESKNIAESGNSLTMTDLTQKIPEKKLPKNKIPISHGSLRKTVKKNYAKMVSKQFTYSDDTSNDIVKSTQDQKESIALVKNDESDADTLSLASFTTQNFSNRKMEGCVSDHVNDQGRREKSNNSKHRTTEKVLPINQSLTENAQELSSKINSENVGFSGTENSSRWETTYTNADCVCKTMERSLSGRVSETKESEKPDALKTQEIGKKKAVNKLASPGKCIVNDSIPTTFEKYLLMSKSLLENEPKLPDTIPSEMERLSKIKSLTQFKPLYKEAEWITEQSNKNKNWLTEQHNKSKDLVTKKSNENKDWVSEQPKENTKWATEQSNENKDWVTEEPKESNDWMTESPMSFIRNISSRNNNNSGTLQSKSSRYLGSKKGNDNVRKPRKLNILDVSSSNNNNCETLKSKLSRSLSSKKVDGNVRKPGKLTMLGSVQETLEKNILMKLSKTSSGLIQYNNTFIQNPTDFEVIKKCRSTLEESPLIKELQKEITILSNKSFQKEVDSGIEWVQGNTARVQCGIGWVQDVLSDSILGVGKNVEKVIECFC